MNIITRASVKERIHVEQIIRSQPRMHNSSLVDIVTIPVRKCLGLSMDVYKPVGEVKEPLPIILDVHGGGLIAGRKEQNRNLGIQLARRGYIVFIPDYRLVPETDIFGQISDILDALAVIEAKATEFGGNIEKLFVTADSAGAFLASMAVASLHHPTEMQPVIRRLERYIPQKVQALRVTAMGFQSGMFYIYKGQVGLLANNYMQKSSTIPSLLTTLRILPAGKSGLPRLWNSPESENRLPRNLLNLSWHIWFKPGNIWMRSTQTLLAGKASARI